MKGRTVSTALILAGSRGGPDPVALSEGLSHKSLAQIGGGTMLGHVVAALREANFERVLVSSDIPEVMSLAVSLGAEVIPSGSGPSESVDRAFKATGAPLLVTTADHPLLSADWIHRFIGESPVTADVSVMLARQADVEAALPGSRRTWLRFADGGWSGCNLFLLATPDAVRALGGWRQVESERKKPWRLARRLGWRTLFDYGLGRLAMADAVSRLGRRLGIQAVLVPASDGLAAVDVDKVDDLVLVRRLLERPTLKVSDGDELQLA